MSERLSVRDIPRYWGMLSIGSVFACGTFLLSALTDNLLGVMALGFMGLIHISLAFSLHRSGLNYAFWSAIGVEYDDR